MTIPFTVTVPADASARQYLAGITIEPATQPGPTTLGSNGQARAQAVIVHQINIGVAITVGQTTALNSQLSVSSLTSKIVGTTPALVLTERNTGQIFTHAKGSYLCVDGARRFTYPVASGTVLPDDTAQLVTGAPGLPPGGSVHCTVNLAYERGGVAVHSALVKIPKLRNVKIVHTGPGVYSEVPAAPGMPTWAYVLIGLGGAVLLALLVVAVLLLRRRTPATPPAAEAPAEEPPDSPGVPGTD